jgi:hypothetical protein
VDASVLLGSVHSDRQLALELEPNQNHPSEFLGEKRGQWHAAKFSHFLLFSRAAFSGKMAFGGVFRVYPRPARRAGPGGYRAPARLRPRRSTVGAGPVSSARRAAVAGPPAHQSYRLSRRWLPEGRPAAPPSRRPPPGAPLPQGLPALGGVDPPPRQTIDSGGQTVLESGPSRVARRFHFGVQVRLLYTLLSPGCSLRVWRRRLGLPLHAVPKCEAWIPKPCACGR